MADIIQEIIAILHQKNMYRKKRIGVRYTFLHNKVAGKCIRTRPFVVGLQAACSASTSIL